MVVNSRTKRQRTVAQAVTNKRWIRDIIGPLTAIAITQYLQLWVRMEEVQLQDIGKDKICWRWIASHQFTSQSAYKMFFMGATMFEGANLVWKTWAAPKVKLFIYFAMHRRTWTVERRKRHGLQDHDDCTLYDQEQEKLEHLLL
ncbi:hypothetical protein PR202_gb20591 [Eleusine coracana subsp. coracana]|uniref:Reverse transcriptase zinc-binding domain-containing protein n=1 Tax=Eleusine coracana subsp. coracana TaxID=191504 RepID=A0AAV5FCX9_ELECO|nr:hypothetical protein PR202_gb20591 [Eleusine coracana subsp. coracana]